MNKEKFKGIIAPVITPFTKEGMIDEDLFREEVRYLLNTGIDGISPGGSTGEGATLDDNELVRLVQIIKEENIKHIPVVCGIIRNSTYAAVRAGLAVKNAGADALMVTPTFYLGGTDDKGNYEYYKKIAESVDLPIIVYNVIADNEIKPNLFQRILEIENVIGIKQSVGGIQGFLDMKMSCGDRGLVYSATDDMLYMTFDMGADGAIAAILSVFPNLCVKMWRAIKEGDNKTAKEVHNKLYPIWNVIKGPQFQRRVKAAINLQGRNAGFPRHPLLEATEHELTMLKDLISKS